MRSTALSLVLGMAVLGAACSGHNSPVSPTSPTASSAAASIPAASAATGATISGTVVGLATASRMRAMSAAMTVSVAGTSTMTSVDGSGHFVLQNVPPGAVTLQFTGAGVNAALTLPNVAPNSTVTISVQVSGATAQLDTGDTESPDNEAEIEGTVTAIGKSTLTVAGRTISVTSSTMITHGGTPMTLADIHVGDRVHVQGTASGSGSSATIAANTIEVQDGADTPGDGGDKNPNTGGDQGGTQTGSQVELGGAVSGRSGSCPAITFTVSSTKVTTSGSTQYEGLSCSMLADGASVEVKGTRQANGSVLAATVQKK